MIGEGLYARKLSPSSSSFNEAYFRLASLSKIIKPPISEKELAIVAHTLPAAIPVLKKPYL